MTQTAGTNTRHFTSQQFEQDITNGTGVAVVDFWAEWCPPCRILGPTIDALADDLAGSALVGKVDVDQAKDLAAKFAISSIPTVVIFRDGKEVNRFVGIVGKDVLASAVEEAARITRVA